MIKKLTIKNGIIQDKEIDGIPIHIKIVQPKGSKNARTLIPMKKLIGQTFHNTGNPNADDSDHAKWLQGVENADKLYVSPHVFIDCDSITQVIPLNEVGYHAGDGKGNGNMNTIGIEICEDRELAKAETNAIKFGAAMMLTYPYLKNYKHQDWNGKYCPHIILNRNGWKDFVDDIVSLCEVAKNAGRMYTVKSGDSLWAIAAKLLGDGNRFNEIKELNNLTSNIIFAGNVLKIPEK